MYISNLDYSLSGLAHLTRQEARSTKSRAIIKPVQTARRIASLRQRRLPLDPSAGFPLFHLHCHFSSLTPSGVVAAMASRELRPAAPPPLKICASNPVSTQQSSNLFAMSARPRPLPTSGPLFKRKAPPFEPRSVRRATIRASGQPQSPPLLIGTD